MEYESLPPEQVSAEVRHNESGIDVTIKRRDEWHFSDAEEAKRFFQRRYAAFLGLHWGARVLVLGGVFDVIRNVEQHDLFSTLGAIAVGGLVLIVEGINEQAIDERLRLYRNVRRQDFHQTDNAGSS